MSLASLTSSAHGRLRRVLVTVPYWVMRYGRQVEIRPYVEGYEALLGGLPDDTERVVAVHEEAREELEGWLARVTGAPWRTVGIPDDLTFTIWAQDACAVQREPGGNSVLLTPSVFPRGDDAAVLGRVARAIGLETVPTDLVFQGGNLLVGDDFWLLGADAVQHTMAAGEGWREGDDAAVLERFREVMEPGRRLVVLGSDLEIPATASRAAADPPASARGPWQENVHTGSREGTRQPLFDLDTFVSLAGRDPDGTYRLLVGDPRLAADLTGIPLPDHALADVFDDVAARLGEDGFRVVRNPLPLVHDDDRVLRRRNWYFASSNNVITEIDGDRRWVWMPTYGDEEHPRLADTDRENERLWNEAGFHVERLPTFHVFARGLGAAHCVVKCLDRAPSGAADAE